MNSRIGSSSYTLVCLKLKGTVFRIQGSTNCQIGTYFLIEIQGSINRKIDAYFLFGCRDSRTAKIGPSFYIGNQGSMDHLRINPTVRRFNLKFGPIRPFVDLCIPFLRFGPNRRSKDPCIRTESAVPGSLHTYQAYGSVSFRGPWIPAPNPLKIWTDSVVN